jgi:hypothetical protein
MQKPVISALAIITFFSLIFSGCTTYNLSPKDEAWNPYHEGDRFTFISNSGDERTFRISTIEKTQNRVNIYAGNLSKLKESLTVFAVEENGSSEEFPLLAIFKNSKDISFVNFVFAFPEMLEINHVEEIPDAELKLGTTSDFDGNDFLNINPTLNVSSDVTIPYAINFIFSKSVGFVQFSLTNGEVWNLERN